MKARWTNKTLADVCTVFADGDWIESKDQSTDGIRLIQTGNVGEGEFKDRSDKARYISEGTFARLRCTEIFEGDCLISRLPDPVGRSAILPDTGKRMITAVDCTIVRFDQTLCLPTFFNYYSQSTEYINNIAERCTGTTRNRISRSQLGNTTLPIPSIKEQHRIVTLLDEAFADIATAKANAEKNLQNARELFDSALSAIEGKKEQLGEYVTIQTGKLDANAAVNDGEYPFFTCSREIFAIDTVAFDCEAILLAGNNAVGDFNVKHYSGKFNAYQRTYVITIQNEEVLRYRYLYFQMLKSLKKFKEQSVGSSTKFLKLGMIKELEITLPPVHEQDRQLKLLSGLLEQIEDLETIYRQKLTALDDLKKSLLHQAFSGQLRQQVQNLHTVSHRIARAQIN